MQVPRLTPQELEARRQAFPDLYKFLDKVEGIRGPADQQQPAMQMQREEEKKKVHSRLTRFADEEETEEDEERWDESVLFDAPLATTPSPEQLNMSAEEHEALLEANEFTRRLNADDPYEDDANVLLFRKLDQENELMRIQHEHVQNMPEFIGFNEEFEEEETRIRQEWMDDPRSVTADHVQELYNNLEQARQRLWAKYTKQAGERFLAENFDELVMEKLRREEAGEELDEEELSQKFLRSPYVRLDSTFRK